ncbi:polysaccharide deacetylase family protein [Paenibacillus sp. DMB20]|uniref:polysaccharide deacetylase family protein n=1 Tax=Paenibacillus sp. DMB20 TaxID=1642570 RepID=UPI001F1F3CB4|nr:polysaccharide deacetylase family protein [Paenibacillus sp. DMB20]
MSHARLWGLFWIMLLLPLKDTAPAEALVRTADSFFRQDPDHASVTSGAELHEQSDRKEERGASSSLTLSQLMKKYPDTFRTRGPRMKQIALTFDDVPDPRFTPQVLDILKKEGVKATFFAVGDRARKHPDLVARIKRDGHAIGNHSYNHALFSKLSLEQFRDQIERTNRIIKSITGIFPRLIRPPYGEINEEQLRWARKNNYKVVNWNVDSLDWKGLCKDEVKQNILSAAGPGAIVLQHAGGGVGSDLTGTIKALPEVISELRRKGYRFVTLPEMLGVKESL